jgi:predicted transcriptional regulator
MRDSNHQNILNKAHEAKLSEATVSQFMSSHVFALHSDYTVKSTIETFRVQHISGAPVVDFENKIIGIISEYDLLIQAATRLLSGPIDYKSQIIAVYPETTLKEVLIILYKNKLKWMPVINKQNYLQGVVARIDVLNFIATHSDL